MGEGEYAHFNNFGVSKGGGGGVEDRIQWPLPRVPLFPGGRQLLCGTMRDAGSRRRSVLGYGDEKFFLRRIPGFNVQDIERCEDGTLFVVDGENNLLTLKELGYPPLRVPGFFGARNH